MPTKSLYIHIPFCKKICAYCDFVKCIYLEEKANKYIDLVIKQLNKQYKGNKFSTIYIGGGTPNSLNDKQLDKLLSNVSKFLNKSNFEFTIELNPEFITKKQASVLYKNKINRVSIGVQTLNLKLLKTMNRLNHKKMVSQSIKILQKVGIKNISTDLIYGFNGQTNNSIKNDIDFLIAKNVTHISCYSLEIKENTLWGKKGYQVNEDEIDNHLSFIIKYLDSKGFIRYEVSNWAKREKYESKHNISVWKTNDWAAIGLGAHGFENQTLYHYEGSLLEWKLIKNKVDKFNLYLQVLMMGLRLKDGLSLSNHLYLNAYKYFKEVLNNEKLIEIKHNHIICKNINLLDNVLIKLMNYENK